MQLLPRLFAMLLALGGASEGGAREFRLSSSAFAPDASIPVRHTCDGDDQSPPLTWTSPPAGARGLALVCEDPDAPRGLWVHWVLWGIPPDAGGLPGGVERTGTTAGGARQGRNDFGTVGYRGPCPPPGAPHRYVFTLYALDAVPELPPGATRQDLLAAIRGHELGRAALVGRYGQP